ncbi:GyrI-like domain-containing protein [Shewanella electrodiphila]|uniref:GyrI-like domain-containing protein n=1 Tax=Shewanella electrodiphila TaxID=934143 RepID=A0ABT0KNI6_9GAMM|nr:GyrI-like domain-containing protein [Shewanella electrodiphila]MCL1045334.1 GyrI-like domain-containing protein [Shewanella electrodiphila]
MQHKYEWRKKEKALYLPKNQPEIIDVPDVNFITIQGEGSPADSIFTDYIGALYSLAYTIKMLPKKMENQPQGYFDFTVYPLEGVWDINDTAKANFNGVINKADLVYKLMIRQPHFVTEGFFSEMLAIAKTNKKNPLLDQVCFETISEGRCVQMLHLGPFEDEPVSFEIMEAFTKSEGLSRVSKVHREIYLSDTRKVEPKKLKTVLRFQVT